MKFRELVILLVLLALAALFQVLNPMFLSPGNIAVMLRSSAFVGIVAVGMGALLMSGMIDLSVGSTAGLASIVFAYTLVSYRAPVWIAILAALAAGVICGLVNAFLILKLKLPAFLATIGTMYIYRGLAQTVSKGYTIFPLPDAVNNWGGSDPLGVSWGWWGLIVLILAGEWILHHTVWGLKVRAIGSDREIARMTEVDVDRVSTHVFVLCAVLAAIAGLLLTARVASGTPTLGEGWELGSITAAAIGGVSLFGYEGSLFGVLLGVLLIQVIQNGLVVSGGSAYLQPVEVGTLLLITAVLDIRRKAKMEERKDSSR